jgi:demethylmenaquinone methyltransferase / 2-methoxy-6-polyprenyl-1,4-benzoquinol methylase
MNQPENINLDPAGKAARVRQMFAEIAPRYDFLNHTLSLNIDKRWRRFVVKCVAEHLRRPRALALDLCCGTGDLALELGRLAETCGADFCHPMLEISLPKVAQAANAISIIEADALKAPFADRTFDVVTVAFGLRNLESVEGGLREIYRLLKPGGRAAVLEFSRPALPGFRQLFQFYFMKVLPRIGNAVSGSSFAYQYLPESVQQFPDQRRLQALMRAVGFSGVTYYNLFGGVAAVHVGDKP